MLDVTEALRSRGLIGADAPPPSLEESARPWFVSLMLGAAGWLAGIFLLVFIGITFRPEEGAGFIVLGLVLLGSAWGLYRADTGGAFLGQLALALSIAGQIALAVGMLEDVRSALIISAVLLLLQLVVLAVMPDNTARTIAALFAVIAWVSTVRFAIYPGADLEDWFGSDYSEARFGAWSAVVVWLITWPPLVALVVWLVSRETQWMPLSLRAHARPALSGLLIAVALAGLASEPLTMLTLGPGMMGVDLGWWSLFPLLSIALAMFAAWCAFRLRSIGLLGLAVVAALLHLSRFYYLFGTSLLWKSAIMLVAGALLLGGAYLLRGESARSAA
jgi:hypothetical protein